MRVVDRSRIETYFKCPRQRYYGYEVGGTGITRVGSTPIDLAYGLAFHEAADVILGGGKWQDGYAAGLPKLASQEGLTVDGLRVADEYAALLYGHVRAFGEWIAPSILARFDVLCKETEMALQLAPDVLYLARLDLGVRDKSSGFVYNFEYKTDRDPSNIYSRMEFYLQMMLESACMAAHTGEVCHGSIVLGIEKGARKGPTEADKRNGLTSGERRLSPFTYAYRKVTPEGTDYRIDYTAAKGWERFPVWTFSGGAEGWYERMTSDLGFNPTSQFVETLPIRFDESRWESVKRQIVAMEARLGDAALGVDLLQTTDEMRDMFYPQNFANCKNDGGYGRQCAFVDLCHFGGDPADDAVWTPRVPNHPLEESLAGG